MSTIRKVMIVDDEEQSRLYLANILTELYPEMEIVPASSPMEAVFLLGRQCFDLLFLDVEMPGMSGLEMLAQLRSKIAETPVIFVSAYKRAEFIQQAMRLNAVDYIDKPVDPIELKTAITKTEDKQSDSKAMSHPLITNRYLHVNTVKGQMLFDPNEVLYFESAKRNSIVYFSNGNKEVLVRENLVSLLQILPNTIFKRVNRKYIVNTTYIKYISRCNQTLTLATSYTVIELRQISTSYYDNFE